MSSRTKWRPCYRRQWVIDREAPDKGARPCDAGQRKESCSSDLPTAVAAGDVHGCTNAAEDMDVREAPFATGHLSETVCRSKASAVISSLGHLSETVCRRVSPRPSCPQERNGGLAIAGSGSLTGRSLTRGRDVVTQDRIQNRTVIKSYSDLPMAEAAGHLPLAICRRPIAEVKRRPPCPSDRFTSNRPSAARCRSICARETA